MMRTNRNMLDTLSRLHGLRFIEGESVGEDPQPIRSTDDAAPGNSEQPADGPKPKAPDNPLPDDPDSLRAEIAKLRKENASARVNAKKTAADEARNALTQEIGKALGFVKDDDAQQIDPADLTRQVTDERSKAKAAETKLAVYMAAGDAADPAALLDSRSFLDAVSNIDPSDQGAIGEAITKALESNPRLAKAPTQTLKPNRAQGASAAEPLGLAERAAAATKAGDAKEAMRIKAAMALQASEHNH